MDFLHNFSSSDIKLDSLLDFTPLTNPQKQHLTKVYGLLSYGICMAAVGVAFNNFILNLPSLLCFIGGLALIFIGDISSRNSNPLKPFTKTRFLAYSGFFFLSGCSIGSLMYIANSIDPTIIPTAFFGTLAIFTCFSICSYYVKDRTFLFISAILSSFVFYLFLFEISNIFIRSRALENVTLYLGFFMFLGYVVYDTQVILREFSYGKLDYFSHGLTLFVDFFSIFVRLVIILLKNNKRRQEEKKK